MWPRIVTAGLGVWLMAASSILGYAGMARNIDVIAGALTASVAIVAMSEVMRPLRWVNVLLGGMLVLAPWVLDYSAAAFINSSVVGIIVAGAALVRGAVTSRFGGGWSAVRATRASDS